MSQSVTKVLLFVVSAFCLFAIFTNPTQAGDFVGSIFVGIAAGLAAIGEFFNTILT